MGLKPNLKRTETMYGPRIRTEPESCVLVGLYCQDTGLKRVCYYCVSAFDSCYLSIANILRQMSFDSEMARKFQFPKPADITR